MRKSIKAHHPFLSYAFIPLSGPEKTGFFLLFLLISRETRYILAASSRIFQFNGGGHFPIMKRHDFTTIHEFWRGIDRLAVTTHCGYIGRYPENSLTGLKAAVELGTDWVEFDVRATADGELVLLHDPTIDRIANGTGPVNQFTYAELAKLNFSYFEYFVDCSGRKLAAPRYEKFPITRFIDVLDALRGKVFMNIQVYAGTQEAEKRLCGIFREYDLYEQAYFTMSNYEEARFIRSVDPDIELCVLDRPTTMAVLHTLRDFGCHVAQPRWLEITPEYCETSRKLGIFSNVYYANLERDIRRYAEMGIQGILTDYPENAIAYNESVKKAGAR